MAGLDDELKQLIQEVEARIVATAGVQASFMRRDTAAARKAIADDSNAAMITARASLRTWLP
jgi:hypothetical protein